MVSAAAVPRSVPRRFIRHRAGLVGLSLALAILACVSIAPLAYDRDARALDTANKLQPPSTAHPLGTDHLGRDQLARILEGGRLSLVAGSAALAIGLAIGLIVGSAAGLLGGALDVAVMRFVDVVLAVPTLVLSLVILAVVGVGLTGLVVAMVVTAWPVNARLARSMAVQARTRSDILAARMAGASRLRVAFHHVMPAAATQLLVLTTLELGHVLGAMAALSFLGLGIQPPTPEWGSMLEEARLYLRTAPWLTWAPVAVIALSVLAANLIGSALRDAADPRPAEVLD